MVRLQRYLKYTTQAGAGFSKPTGSIKPSVNPVGLASGSRKPELKIVENATIQNWNPARADRTCIGTVFNVNQAEYDVSSISLYLHDHFKLTKSSGILFRESTLELFDLITKENSSEQPKTILLEGKRGNGKSTTLFQAVSHFQALPWIVLYFPNPLNWTIGRYPYEFVKEGGHYIQPELAADLLKSILSLNQKRLEGIAGIDGAKNLAVFMKRGVDNLKESHKVLMKTLDRLLQGDASVLLAIDQVNALYSNTKYFDTESRPLSADKFAIINKFLNLMSTPTKNVVKVLSVDNSKTIITSKYLNKLASTAPYLKQDPYDLSIPHYQKPSTLDGLNVKLPSKIDPTFSQDFSDSYTIGNLHRFVVPALNTSEAQHILQFLRKTHLLTNDVSDDYVKKSWMITQGNALELFQQAQ